MIMKAIGFHAEATDQKGTYDCSFMIIYPLGSVSDSDVQIMEQKSIAQFNQFHPGGRILARMERTLVGPGSGPFGFNQGHNVNERV